MSGVLMVTGAYWPEVSGASRQCRQLVQALGSRVDFRVLTTTTDRSLPARVTLDGAPVRRVFVGTGQAGAARAAVGLTAAIIGVRRRFEVLHLHGVSRKSAPLARIARALGKRVVLKLTSVGEDDPMSFRARRHRPLYEAADVVVGPSPEMERRYRAAGLDPARFRLIPNGVDLARFRPVDEAARGAARRALDLPDEPVVLFVGYFSRDKRPHTLFEAWARVREAGGVGTLLFVGATHGPHPEIDPTIVQQLRADAERRGLAKHVAFIERTEAIERVYAAADVFVLPSVREGLPNALLEAMASGLPCVATRLPGVTDTLIADGTSGWLVAPDDAAGIAATLGRVLGDPIRRATAGRAARAAVERGYGFDATAAAHLAIYRALGGAA
jgi:glycosyltransferase involved in cell wall biosynthesis